MISIFIAIIAICAISFYFYMTRKFNYWKRRGVPFIKPIPLFGNILDICVWRASIGDFCKSVYENTSEPFIGFFILDEPCLMVNDIELIKNILIKDFVCFQNRTMANNEKHDTLGSNILFLMKTPKWRNIRRKMTPAFSSGKMMLMSKLMIDCSEQLVRYMNKITENNNILDVRELCGKFTTNTITSTSFGLEAECFENENSPFRVVARRIYNWQMFWHAVQTNCFFIAPKLVHIFNMHFIDQFSTKFFKNVFWNVMKEREENKIVRNDLLDILIEMRKQDKIDNVEYMDGDLLLAQAVQFFIAGFETTSSTMSFALMELAKYPEIQEKTRKHILHCKEKFNGSFNYDSIREMYVLENVLLETLRKYPIVPFLDRRCSKKYAIPGSHLVLEKDDMIYIPVMGIHYDEKYYPDPYRFDPDRFLQENSEKRPSMTFLPFGSGPRNCIGNRFALLNAKCGLAHLLTNYEVKLCKRTERDFQLSSRGFLLQPTNGIYLECHKIVQE